MDCSASEPEPKDTADWSVLAGELSDYIDPLPTDPCGETCDPQPEEGFYTYIYFAPAHYAFWHSMAPDSCTEASGCYSNEAYGLFAENLEDSSGGISYGFGSW